MKRFTIVGTLLIVLFIILLVDMTSAQSDVPEDVDVFYIGNLICIKWPDGSGECHCPCDEPLQECEKKATPTPQPTLPPPVNPTPTDIPPTPMPPEVFCHCEQGEGEGAEGRKNCHPVNYTPGHAKHEWDYLSLDGTCEGWNH